MSTRDAVVIGAGPAGCVVAHGLATQGFDVLLVDAKSFPRDKVCGGCLSYRGVRLLDDRGLLAGLLQHHPPQVDLVQVAAAGRTYRMPIPAGLSISRRTMDHQLAAEAAAAGAECRFSTRATVVPRLSDDFREVQLASAHGEVTTVWARVVIAADGLGHPSLQQLPAIDSRVARHSRIGLGAVVAGGAWGAALPAGLIDMHVHPQGYVGLARCEGDAVSIAAALEPSFVARCNSPDAAIREIMQSDLLTATGDGSQPAIKWVGTRPLTQASRDVAATRLLLVGDAASYVEPFTGEGMTAAIAGAVDLIPIAAAAITGWSDDLAQQWRHRYRQHHRRRQLACRVIAQGLRSPWLTRWGLSTLTALPPLARGLAGHLHGPRR